ncbi:MAG: hypothetical protein AAF438_02800 [Pseudomonadota bacterium]
MDYYIQVAKFYRKILAVLLLASMSPTHAATPLWWDTNYPLRYNINVVTGPASPDKGYVAYTARIPSFNTAALISAGEMRADCADLRILFFDGTGWNELPRQVLDCNTTSTDIRFALQANIAASSNDDNYYLYTDNNAPAALPAVSETNVYLWFDDASINRATNYVRGRIDPWHGTGWDNSLVWNPAGYYTYDNGDNFTSGYRIPVDERDVYAEAEFFHTGCYQLNITTGMVLRGIIGSGSFGSESSSHYYASNRGEFPTGCTTGGYSHDGDIMDTNRNNITVDGANPPDILASTWRRQGFAAWLVNPTNLSFWDEDLASNWAALGFPNAGNLQVAGTDTNDYEGRGFAGFMNAQDVARVRNILIRRFVQPEPVLALTREVFTTALTVQKTSLAVFDPVNNTINPKRIPGGYVDYTITTRNNGPATVDANTLDIMDPLPNDVSLFVGDLSGPTSGPVEFVDGAGASNSGLTFSFVGLSSLTDDVEFSQDGLNFSYIPSPDVNGFDDSVRFIRVTPSGSFQAPTTATPTEFQVRFRVRIN